MNKKIITFSLLLSLSGLAIGAGKDDKLNNNNFTLDLSDVSSFNFKQVEPNVYLHEDNFKSIEVLIGSQGIQRYITDMENELLTLENTGIDSPEKDYKYVELINNIELYRSKIDQMANQTVEKSDHDLKVLSSFNSCFPNLSQQYYFIPQNFFTGFRVESSYPEMLGPFPGQPPVVAVTIHAESTLHVIPSSNGNVLQPRRIVVEENNSFTGNNYNGGIATATAVISPFFNNWGVIDSWEATSVMSQPNCFEYIHVTGTGTL